MDEHLTEDRQFTKARTRTVLNALDRAWVKGDVDALDTVLAPAFQRHGSRSSQTRDELKASILMMRRSFPDLTMTVAQVIEGENDLAVRWTSTGTLSDEYLGLPANGREYSVSGSTFSTFDGETIVEETVVYDKRGEYSSFGLSLRGARAEEEKEEKDGAEPGETEAESVGTVLRAMHRKMVTGVTVVAVVDADGEPR
ncbi:MAG: hypothetical protein JWR01_2571, partial [Subtercola sp.]|nr:hypothetical protein [Subtercola sp.]